MGFIYYRCKQYPVDYGFSVERKANGTLRAYIRSMPSYSARDTSLHVTHRLRDDDGRHYVCWTLPIYREADLRQIMAKWADLTQNYIMTGQTIDQQVARMSRRA